MVAQILAERERRDVSRLLNTPIGSQLVLLSGPSQTGKQHLLRRLYENLRDENQNTQWINNAAPAPLRFTATDPPTLFVPNVDRLHPEVSLVLNEALHAGARVFASAHTSPDLGLSDPEGIPRQHLREHTPYILDIQPFTEAELFALFLEERPLNLSIDAGIQCVDNAWGRAGWLLRVMQAVSQKPELLGLLSTQVLSPVEYPKSPADPFGVCNATTRLTYASASMGLVLANLPPQPLVALMALIGTEHTNELRRLGVLIEAPNTSMWGVPKIFGSYLSQHTSEEAFAQACAVVSDALFSQSQFGIPLSPAEEHLCELSLQRQALSLEIRSAFQNAFFAERFTDNVVFGNGEIAKSILLTLGPQAPGVCQLQRARLVTLLQDATAGLHSLFLDEMPQANCILPSADALTRTGLLALRAQLASETGTPFSINTEISHEDTRWNHALQVISAWNNPLNIPVSPTDPIPVPTETQYAIIGLLANLLHELDQRQRGVGGNAAFSSQFRLDFGHAIRNYLGQQRETRQLDDLFLTAIIGHEILSLFLPCWPQPDSSLADLSQLLAGGKRHQQWASHLRLAKQHLFSGNIELFALEFSRFCSTVPRFLPLRLRKTFESLEAAAVLSSTSSRDFPIPSALMQYFRGNYEYFASHQSVWAELGRKMEVTRETSHQKHESGHDTEHAFSESLTGIAAHIRAELDQNPAALQRVALTLENMRFYGPARSALQSAQHIYRQRRASGSSSSVATKITELDARIQADAPWQITYLINSRRDTRIKLTRREREIGAYVSLGLSNHEIAAELNCSVRTIESHIANARAKLGAPTRHEFGKQFIGASEQPL